MLFVAMRHLSRPGRGCGGGGGGGRRRARGRVPVSPGSWALRGGHVWRRAAAAPLTPQITLSWLSQRITGTMAASNRRPRLAVAAALLLAALASAAAQVLVTPHCTSRAARVATQPGLRGRSSAPAASAVQRCSATNWACAASAAGPCGGRLPECAFSGAGGLGARPALRVGPTPHARSPAQPSEARPPPHQPHRSPRPQCYIPGCGTCASSTDCAKCDRGESMALSCWQRRDVRCVGAPCRQPGRAPTHRA